MTKILEGLTMNIILIENFSYLHCIQQAVCQNGGGRKPCFNICFSILLHIRQDVSNLAICISSTFSYKFIFGKPGRTQQLFPHFGKPYRNVQAGSYYFRQTVHCICFFCQRFLKTNFRSTILYEVQ